MKILIINGPNLNLLGKREPHIYGYETMDSFVKKLKEEFHEHEIDYYQSNVEGEIIDRLQKENYEAIIINPGAYTHYSYAIADCLKNIETPKIEIHISNIYQREKFRQHSVTAPYVDSILSGFGLEGYRLAVLYSLTKKTKSPI